MKLEISPHTLQEMQGHAESDYPNECCGFFYGLGGEIRKVHIARATDNAKEGDQRRRFMIDPQDYQEAEQYAVDNDLDLLGVYHSHPDHPAEPSEHDRKVAMPWFSYIIISVSKGNAGPIRSWRLNNNREFVEEQVEVKEIKPTQKF